MGSNVEPPNEMVVLVLGGGPRDHTLLGEVRGRFTMTASEEMSGTGDLDILGLVSFMSRGFGRTAEPSSSC